MHGVKPGPKPYLDEPEEKELSSYLKHCAKVGYGKTRKDVLCIVETATSECGRLRTSHVSDGWWRRFKERQGDLSLRQGDSTGHVRMDAMNRETIDHYFALLHNTVFSAEQEEHFERRYEGGYDLPDPVYEEWLKLRHPPSFRATSPPGTSSGQELSLSDQFTAVSPLTPVALNITIVSGASTSSGATSSKPTEHTPTLLSSGSSGSSGRKKDDSLSKQLVVPSAATPAGPKKAPHRARLLTSTAALEIIEEKEQKKKRELELKEQRKRAREENKRKREEDQKRKLEERTRKAKQKEQKAAEKTRKTDKTMHTSSTEGEHSTVNTRSSAQPPLKKVCVAEEIDESKCCVCFTTYEEDVQKKKSVQRTAYWTVQGKKDCANYVWIYMSHDAFLFSFSLDISHDAFCIPFFT